MSFNSRWVSQQYSSEGPRNPGEKDQQGKHRAQTYRRKKLVVEVNVKAEQ